MNVRLLVGNFFSFDGSAINDFESLSVVNPIVDLRPGVVTEADCNWDETIFLNPR